MARRTGAGDHVSLDDLSRKRGYDAPECQEATCAAMRDRAPEESLEKLLNDARTVALTGRGGLLHCGPDPDPCGYPGAEGDLSTSRALRGNPSIRHVLHAKSKGSRFVRFGPNWCLNENPLE